MRDFILTRETRRAARSREAEREAPLRANMQSIARAQMAKSAVGVCTALKRRLQLQVVRGSHGI
jgi:hypothetical protein